jgi:hypothetical protein
MTSNEDKGRQYEELVRRIMTELRHKMQEIDVSEIRSGVMGASDYAHKIDLSIRAKDVLTLLECKCWKTRIKPEALLRHAARVYGISKAQPEATVRGAVVIKNGLGPGRARHPRG